MVDGNGSEWARQSIGDIREDVRGIRKEIGRDRDRADRRHGTVMLKLDDINDHLAEIRGASKMAGAVWGGFTSIGLGLAAWLTGLVKR